MSKRNHDVRCKGCGAKLADLARDGLTIRRGKLQATITGAYHVSLVCYRPHCGTLNVVRHDSLPWDANAAA
jgi:hypothetical protein